jgi:DNA polymerase-3 subunit beta
MEIKIPRGELLKGLSVIQGIVERKTTMPILANVLMDAKGKNLTLTATDLEVGVINTMAAEVLRDGKLTVHARGLYDIVKELPDETVHMNALENQWVEILCGKARFKIVGLSPDEFPSLPKKGSGVEVKIPADTFKEMIEKTSFAMSTDETRYNLNGVFVEQVKEGEKEFLRMVATDGHRLSIIDREIGGKWKLAKGVIIPRKGIIELKRLVDLAEGSIELTLDEKHVIASNKQTTLIIRLIDGQFPPYKQVMPTQLKRVIGVDRKNILEVLRRVSVMSADRSRGVKFVFSPKNLEVSTSNPDFGEAKEELSINYKGEKFEIGFNARYFIDVFNVIDDEETQLQMGDDTTPCVLKSDHDRGFTHIVMPMRL